jgi:flagellar secretion chaperone FliS
MSFAVSRYQNAKVQTASPAQIVVQLYDGAIRFMKQAMEAEERGDATTKGNLLRKSHAIVSELSATLDHSQAPELCAELERLYEFVMHAITQAHVASKSDTLPGAIKVLDELRGAWAELARRS